MCDFQTTADRFDIQTLRAEFTDAAMMHDYDRFASLFTCDEVWRIPHANNDRYQRTPDGWNFCERVYEIRYAETSPLTASAPDAAELARLGQKQLRRLTQIESE
jgi:hypothetical protein